jgi:hypothetical protein
MASGNTRATTFNVRTNFVNAEEDVPSNKNDAADDGSMEIPEKLKHFVNCQYCRTVFNADFELFEYTPGNIAGVIRDVNAKYTTNTECSNCQGTFEDVIDQCHFYPFYEYNANMPPNRISSVNIRNIINQPVTCTNCRRQLNATYTFSNVFLPTTRINKITEVFYDCTIQCSCCQHVFTSTICDKYRHKKLYDWIYQGNYGKEEEKVADNQHLFELTKS